MRKGFIFSIDAIFAIAITIALLSGIIIVTLSEKNSGNEQTLFYTKATDKAIAAFYTNDESLDTPGTKFSNCKEIFKYNGTGTLATEALKCETQG